MSPRGEPEAGSPASSASSGWRARRSPAELARAITERRWPEDREFDELLPWSLKAASRWHFTPLPVVARICAWLERHGVRDVVDVGAGAGKFCVAAALGSHARFVGIEQRPALVAAAEALKARFELGDRVTFVHAELGDVPTPEADAYYFYNPFGENLAAYRDRIDERPDHGLARFDRDLERALALLDSLPDHTFLITYGGLGGPVPSVWELVDEVLELTAPLRLYQKRARSPGDEAS